MKKNEILITGGTGKTGRRVMERLQRSGEYQIRIGSRSQTPPFDWNEPGSWVAALKGVDTVYITFQPDLAIPSAPSIIQSFTSLASSHGVRKMVLLSGRGEAEAQRCEDIVKATASSWTIIRASWFNQNFSEGFFLNDILAGRIVLPRVASPEPFVDADDIADVVVKCLLDDKHNTKTYELTGPELLTFEQAIHHVASASANRLEYEEMPMDAYEEMMRSYHVPEDQLWLIRYLFTEVLDGRNASITNDVELVLGRKARSFSQFAAESASLGIWSAASLRKA